MHPFANDFITLYSSPEPQRLFAYSPGIARLPNGWLVATLDLGGPGATELPEPKYPRGEMGWSWQGKVFTSDDGGQTPSLPDARPRSDRFRCGGCESKFLAVESKFLAVLRNLCGDRPDMDKRTRAQPWATRCNPVGVENRRCLPQSLTEYQKCSCFT